MERSLDDLDLKKQNLNFLLENVKMKKEYQDIISNLLGVQPINIKTNEKQIVLD